MPEMTVGEAALRLGIGKARVYQLIRAGMLPAEKVGGIWLVDGASVDARASIAPKSGRPPKLKGGEGAVETYTLMNRGHAVLSFRYDSASAQFLDAGDVADASRAPLGLVSPRGVNVSGAALQYWWKHRTIPFSREGIEEKLKQLGVETTDEIPFRSLGLSLSDQYWICPQGSNLKWKDINFFDNSFPELEIEAGWLDEVGLESPDNTSEGELPKRWIIKDGKRVLLKGGAVLDQEPYNEAVATALYKRLLKPEEYVSYSLYAPAISNAHGAICACENFISSDEEYIPAFYVKQMLRQPNHRNDFQQYLECCAEMEIKDAEQALSKMIVCDSILGNFDRHWRNFGLVRNVETLACRIAPLFDSGNSLWCKTPISRLQAHDYSFTTKPFYEDANRQLRLVNDYSWFMPDALEGFTEEAAEILGGNPALANRIGFVCDAMQGRIDRIIAAL